jgi:uncharacterized protein
VKLHASPAGAVNTITAYGDDYVMVNGQRRDSSLIVTPEQLLPWNVSAFQDLKEEDFKGLTALGVDILLLGTGSKQRFPHPRLTAPLAAARIGVEVMDSKAACRTYNVLVAEERKVALALLFG